MGINESVRATGKDVDGRIELEIMAGDFKGCLFYYDGMKFADQENDDGSMNMSFNYEITNDFEIKEEDTERFGKLLGDFLIMVLDEQIKKNEVIYKGGVE